MRLPFLRSGRLPWAILIPIGLWVATMLATPFSHRLGGAPALHRMIVLGTLTQATATLSALAREENPLSTVRLTLLILFSAWLAEFVGIQTGFPFGHYTYTDVLQPQAGGVPLLIPFAWLMMLPPSWAVASWIVRPSSPSAPWKVRLAYALTAACAFTAWDLFLDPQMVHWGLWRWAEGGVYFGIPLSNYLGWLLISFLITLTLAPLKQFAAPLTAIYAITCLLTFVGQLLFWKLPGPAFAGLLGMGSLLILAYRRRYS